MKRNTWLRSGGLRAFVALLAIVFPVAAQVRSPQLAPGIPPSLATASAPLAFRHVTVIDIVTGARRPNQTVVIVGHRIRALGPASAVRVPKAARVVDARGKYLIPGLWDMHTHMHYMDIAYPLFIANGVTGIRELNTAVPLAVMAQWKREVAQGRWIGPRLITSGPRIDGDTSEEFRARCRNGRAGPRDAERVCVTDVREARRIVDSLKVAGADLLKTYFLTPVLYWAVAREARRVGLPLGGHGPYQRDWDPAKTGVSGLALSDSGVTMLDHHTWLPDDPCSDRQAETYNAEQCRTAGEHFRRNGTWIVAAEPSGSPTEALRYEYIRRYVPDSLASRGSGLDAVRRAAERDSVKPPASMADWRAIWMRHPDVAARFDSASGSFRGLRRSAMLRWVPILAGTDGGIDASTFASFPGFGLHQMLAEYVLKGITPLAALQAATLNPARALHAIDSLGTVAVGKLADLVLLDTDPLEDISNTTKIRAVVANGRYYDRDALDRLLDQAAHAAGH